MVGWLSSIVGGEPLADLGDVLGRGHAGRGQPRARLLDRQRQVAELLGHQRGVVDRQRLDPALQVVERLGPGEHVDRHRLGQLRPGRVARRDDDVAGAAGEEVLQLARFLHVVEDQQPAIVGTAPAERLPDRLGGLGGGVGRPDPEVRRQIGQARVDQVALLRRDPPDEVVVGHEAVRVLLRDLRLADAALAVQRDREHDGGALADQLVVQLLEHLVAAGEGRVPGRDAPDRRDRARVPRLGARSSPRSRRPSSAGSRAP